MSRILFFHETPQRVVKRGSEHFIPVVDVAEGLDIDRGNITRTLEAYWEIFEGEIGVVMMTTPGGIQEHLCISGMAVQLLVVRLDYRRVKDPAKRARIIQYIRWAGRVLAGCGKTLFRTF